MATFWAIFSQTHRQVHARHSFILRIANLLQIPFKFKPQLGYFL
jgi:hypothetical protein